MTWLRPFDNTTSGYKEWRKRIQLYARRMAIQKRESEIGISVLSTLTGAAWGQCEDLEVKDLETADGLGRTLDRLDAQWQYDEKIEVPEAFKKYFYKTYRAMNQTILDHCTQAGQAFRKLSKYKISLSLTKRLSSPAKFNNMRGRWKSDRAHFAEDEVYYGTEDEYNDDEYLAYDDYGNILEYDGNDAHWQDDEWDVQSTYNGSTAADDMPSSDAVFDTEEFDRVYAAYADSKRQLNQLRVSRGFSLLSL